MNFSNLFRTEQAHPTNNMERRQNCAVIDFSIIPAKPKPSRVHEFIIGKVQLDWAQVKGLQLNNVMSCVFLKMDSPESVEQFVENNNMKHTMEYKGTTYEIPFFVADGAVDVKLHDLPFDMGNQTIVEHMKTYGEVLSIKNDSWQTLFKGLPNGVRILRMRITKPLPSYVVVAGEMTLCTHKNQIPTCRHCGRRVHYTMKCSEYAKSLVASTQTHCMTNTASSGPVQQARELSDHARPISPVPSRSSSVAHVNTSASTSAITTAVATAATKSVTTITAGNEDDQLFDEVETRNASTFPPSRSSSPHVVSRRTNDIEIASEISDTEIDEINPTPSSSLAEVAKRKISPMTRSRNTPQENFKRPGSPGTKNHDNKRASRSRNRH